MPNLIDDLLERSVSPAELWARLERELPAALVKEVEGQKRWAELKVILKEWKGWCNENAGAHAAWKRAADLVAAARSIARDSPYASAEVRSYRRLLAARSGKRKVVHTELRVPIGLTVGQDGVAAELVLDVLELPKAKGNEGQLRPDPAMDTRLLETFRRSSEIAFAAACAGGGTSRHSDVFYRVEWDGPDEQQDIEGGSASLALWRALVWALDRRPIKERPAFDSRVLVLGEIVELGAGKYGLETVGDIPKKVQAWANRASKYSKPADPMIDHVLVVDRAAVAEAKAGLTLPHRATRQARQLFEYIRIESMTS